ncbi:MAG TPA: aldo/keto reductase [Actinomycetota bacterium]|jgi:aryl-alcohol dehydrogenase-like predicted oxidoreductase
MMEKTVRLGDVEVPRIGLGTNRLSYSEEHVAFVRAAVSEGIRHIDTAHLYTGGQSETTIGAALSPMPRDVVVATKGGYQPGEGRPEVLRAQIDESLQRLRTDAIPLYYLHRVDPETPLEESIGALKEGRDAGKIRHVGISQVSIEQVEGARRIVPIAAVQNHYNLSNRTYDEVVDHCEKEGIVFVPFFPLRGVGSPVLDRIARAHGASPPQIALAWLLRRSPIVLPIPGTLTLDHVRENLGALEIELTAEEVRALG